MTRVLVVDDHAIYRDGLGSLIGTTQEFELLGEAGTAEEAIDFVTGQRPDLVLMDLKLPGMSGIGAVREIMELDPDIRILMVTMFDDDPNVLAAMRAGALGYVLKGIGHEELLRAMRAAANGEAIFSPAIASRMMRFFSSLATKGGAEFSELTARENEVLSCVAQGLSHAEIARRLVLRPKTVRNHVSNIVSKLHVANKAEAADRARNRGM